MEKIITLNYSNQHNLFLTLKTKINYKITEVKTTKVLWQSSALCVISHCLQLGVHVHSPLAAGSTQSPQAAHWFISHCTSPGSVSPMPFFPVLELSQCLCLPSRNFQILYVSVKGSSTDMHLVVWHQKPRGTVSY